jgi:hypothetical protein
MITFVCWRWTPVRHYRSSYAPETVYILRDSVAKHYAKPHRFVCVTDRPDELKDVETIPLWNDWAEIPSRIGHSYPSCYRRLKLLHPEAGKTFGERVISCDLDTVITGDLTPIVEREEDFIIWGESDFPHTTPCCGSLWSLKTGTRPQVWTAFKGQESANKAWSMGCRGSDQGWIAYILGIGSPNGWQEATYTRADGVYSYRKHISRLYNNSLPKDARLVSFHGKKDPWSPQIKKLPWVQEHYRMTKKAAA